MNKRNPLTGLLIIALTTPALLNAAIIESDMDKIIRLTYSPDSTEGKLTGAFHMNGVTGYDTPAHNGDYLYSFNGFGESLLEFYTGDLISLVDGVYTWEGGGFITETGALGREPSPDFDSRNYIVDSTFLTGEWVGPITAQIEDSGNFVIRGGGTNVMDHNAA